MTAIVTADQIVAGLANKIRTGTDSENNLLKDAMVSKNYFSKSSNSAKDSFGVYGDSYPTLAVAPSSVETGANANSVYAIMNWDPAGNCANIGSIGPGTSTKIIAGGQHFVANPVLHVMGDRVESLQDFYVNGKLVASATATPSDKRYKSNISELTGALNLVSKLMPVEFEWTTHPVHRFPEGKTLGFIAQDVQQALADTAYAGSVVKNNECVLPDGSKEDFLGIAESNLIAILTGAIKELTGQVQALTERVKVLEANKA